MSGTVRVSPLLMSECTALGHSREEALEKAKMLLAKRFAAPRPGDEIKFGLLNAAAELGGMIGDTDVVRVRVDLDSVA